jgi:hypothetical protein
MNVSSTENVMSYDDLKQFLGLSRRSLWSCPSCGPSFLPTRFAPSPHYSWGVVLLCGICNSSWMVCKECCNVRVASTLSVTAFHTTVVNIILMIYHLPKHAMITLPLLVSEVASFAVMFPYQCHPIIYVQFKVMLFHYQCHRL